jgi:hypothetical protein
MVGQKLRHYRVLGLIDSGGMGVVYRARDERLEGNASEKILPLGTLEDEHRDSRFLKEGAGAVAKSKNFERKRPVGPCSASRRSETKELPCGTP